MKREIEIKLSAVDEIIAVNDVKCLSNVRETLELMKEDYPNHANEIQERFNEILKKYKVDLYRYIYVSSEERNKYLEQY